MAESSLRLCLVGAGNMGGAMLSGWLESGVEPASITVIDPSPNDAMASRLKAENVRLLARLPSDYSPEVIIIAVKPQLMNAVLPTLVLHAGGHCVFVSVAAGTTLETMEAHLGEVPIVRAMPNTPALVRRGITTCFGNPGVTARQKEMVDTLLAAIGKVEWVDSEKQIDAVTAVSGSGPAYVFHLAEVMAEAGIELGLPEALANRLARETIAGAGEMLSLQDESAAILRKNVTSPNGTTAAALDVLMEDEAMKKLFSRAMAAAARRAEELSRGE